MAIGVSSTVHAAFTLFARARQPRTPVVLATGATAPEPAAESDSEFLQSPRGCVVKRVAVQGAYAWLILLDYGLDEASTAFACTQFITGTSVGKDFEAFIPVLFHIDDRVKVLATVAKRGEQWELVNKNLHAMFFNFQANQQELYPLELDVLPG